MDFITVDNKIAFQPADIMVVAIDPADSDDDRQVLIFLRHMPYPLTVTKPKAEAIKFANSLLDGSAYTGMVQTRFKADADV